MAAEELRQVEAQYSFTFDVGSDSDESEVPTSRLGGEELIPNGAPSKTSFQFGMDDAIAPSILT